MATATTTSSTGAGADLIIFSEATDHSETEEESTSGYCVWMDDFVSMSIPYRRLIESLLWHLHGKGVGVAVLGLFLACLAGSFKQVFLVGLYISTYGTPDFEMARTVSKYGNLSLYFTLREPKFTVMKTTEPRGYEVVATRLRSTFSTSPLNRGCPCGQRSNLNLIKHVWDTCMSSFYTYATRILP